jgi:phenylacetate-CoA ligase
MDGTSSLKQLQWEKLHGLLSLIDSAEDSFYQSVFKREGLELNSINCLEEFLLKCPKTTKADILNDRLAHPPFGTNFTDSIERYTRFCQTSGTSSGQPMAVLDTSESWKAMLDCWRQVYRAAGLKAGEDRIFFAFSFGPFLGFWTAFEAAASEYLALPGGGLSSTGRLEIMVRYSATVLCCTPTYALRLGECIGTASGITLEKLKVRTIIVAGEPGGSLPSTRERLRELWGKHVQISDHHGMTEVGPVTYEDQAHPGNLCVMEEAYLAEILDAEGREVSEGGEGELVLTTLNRTASPLLRYKTGDWVRKRRIEGKLFLEGGILARCDDMLVIRGVNIYPTAIENVVRRFPQIIEFMVEQQRIDNMEELEVFIEIDPNEANPRSILKGLEDKLRDTFSLRIPVKVAEEKSLPRHEFKAKRWLRKELKAEG